MKIYGTILNIKIQNLKGYLESVLISNLSKLSKNILQYLLENAKNNMF